MDTFPIAKREELAAHGAYRTKDLIPEKPGTPYRTHLDPHPRPARHPAKSNAN
ncbi:hypothetical protein [Streptomyces niveus]|uniref:hypothetical protein n=1 Tax=Streptomyces niveus TaxID=193462 RepID=UPI0003C5978C|nr:hypothetical protein [Streptomyces niveus]EST30749.1 hypothetical protein M877_09175 [Streptomyces niveus NCIMB 11891]